MCFAIMLVMLLLCAPVSAFAQESELPAKFDPRQSGRVSAVRQSPQAYNMCWAYATVAAIEQSIIFSGLDNASIDLSESALAWFSGQSEKYSPDPAQRYNNNYIIAPVFAMSRLDGVQYETDEPTYLSEPHRNPVSYSQQGLCEFELESVEKVTGSSEQVKKKLMEYGGAAVCYHSDLDYFSDDHKSYYQNARTDVNHSVTVIGWDDDYSRDNFGSVKPEKDGAWLVKSVWGTRNDDGYYWISYCETELDEFYFYKVRNAVTDRVYTHNGGMDRVFVSSKDSVCAANVFTAQGDEVLTEVSFFVEENGGQGTDYNVKVYKNVSEGSPVDGTQCADISGRVQYDGYYTVKLPTLVELAKGESFSVVVTLKSDNGKNYFVAEDAGCDCEKGQTYFYLAEKGWQDCTNSTFKNAYINAYTQKSGKPDKSELDELIKRLDGKRGMQRALVYAKSVQGDDKASFIEVKKVIGLLQATSNECDSYTVITTAKEWNEFAQSVNSGAQYRDKTVVVEADIDFSGVGFIAAGLDEDRCFNGYFQGNGHIFKNVKASTDGGEPIGVFGYLGKYAYVSGLVVTGGEMNARTAGGIVGICNGGTVTGCGFYGTVSGEVSGGIVGRLENSTISDCWSDVKDISGIVGECADEKNCVLNCFSTAKDSLDGVGLAQSAGKLTGLLNTNGGNGKSVKRFELSGGVVRPLIVTQDGGDASDRTEHKDTAKAGAIVAVCAAVVCSGCAATVAILLKRRKKK